MTNFSLLSSAVGTAKKGVAMSKNIDRQLVCGLLGFCGGALVMFIECDDDGAVPVLLGTNLETGRFVAMTLHDFLVHNPNYQGF